jgi:hypothetical protein
LPFDGLCFGGSEVLGERHDRGSRSYIMGEAGECCQGSEANGLRVDDWQRAAEGDALLASSAEQLRDQTSVIAVGLCIND